MGYTSPYGLVYLGQFDSIPRSGGTSDSYYFNIFKKNSPSQRPTTLICASSPCVHTYLNDEPNTYIKGSELEITVVNLNGSVPLSTFYSEEDDDWKIELYTSIDNGTSVTNQLLFSGYLIQENCEEVLTDIGHEIKLVFNDNLGLLKEIKFADALKICPKKGTNLIYDQAYVTSQLDADGFPCFRITPPGYLINTPPNEGDILVISDATAGAGNYTVTKTITLGSTWYVYVVDEMPQMVSGTIPYLNNLFCTISVFTPYKQTDQIPLIDVYWIIMYNTGIALDFAFANMMWESSETPPVNQTRLLEYVYIGLDTFFDNNDSNDLDTVVQKLNYRFSSSLFQSEGRWCLVRWNELRNTGDNVNPLLNVNKLYADLYLKTDYSWIEREILTSNLDIGNQSDIEEGVLGSIERPLKYIKHTYNYSQNENIPFNGNMSQVGKLLKEYTTGSGTNLKYIKEYEAIGWRNQWYAAVGWTYQKRYIRVVYDNNGNEEDRYLVLDKSNGYSDESRSISSEYPIQMSKGDKLKISFEWRTASPHNGNGTSNAAMPGLTTNPGSQYNWYYVNQDGTWQSGVGSLGTYFNNDWDQWHTVSVETEGIPFDGLAFIMLPNIYNPNEAYTYVKNIEITYTPFVAGQTTIKGHIHKTTIPSTIKNSEEEEIYVDDTQKNYSKGTLFLSTMNGVIRKRTSQWSDGIIPAKMVLGELITRQEHLWRNKRRLKLEGNIFPVIRNQGTANVRLLSMLNVCNFLIQNGTYLIFGKLEIDYKENSSKFTAYEMWRNGEQWYHLDPDPIADGVYKDKNIQYTFKYIYKWD